MSLRFLALVLVLPLLPVAATAQPTHPDLSGLWELRDESKVVPKPALTPAAVARGKEDAARQAAGEIVSPPSRWCQPLGTPFIMGDSAPLDIAQSKYEVAIMAEVQSEARHIYIDGRGHPDMKVFDPTTNGNSIGRWEGGTLVVDTIGFSDKGQTMIPGGGRRGATSRLTERYTLSPDGQKLKVSFHWEDPKVFEKPHDYTFTYFRDPPPAYSMEYFCDASDPARGQN